MPNPSYNIEDVCEAINKFDKKISMKVDNSMAVIEFDNIQNEYCIDENGQDKCLFYEVFVNSYFIKLLNYFMKVDLKHNKNAEYAILWLCHKLYKNSKNGISNLNDFHSNYVKGNEKYIEKISGTEAYNSCKDIINKKIYLKTIDIKEMSKIYEVLKSLCKLYTECDEKKPKYTNCFQDAQDFVKKFENLNQDSSITGNNSYIEILSSLSTDYNNFKSYCGGKCNCCNEIPTLSEIKTSQSSVHGSKATSSSSLIGSKLIPVLSIFAISIFLGIAYKYSLFRFDKRLHGQCLRGKIKKIKKKMNINI
ncbi:Plasmodium variant antigen protein Cir/Yir/Bir, putative [Plasmodium chabaudi chabaudi]|uniref:Plasmodium variant antigen protein Cir/Yir/Bir, putative n=1 Tax=Plasmodium chabaudi chabaudi TaxID=31271 RepID=A0A1D3L7P1_PLACU|nr:Plasmodium variant antigen protein Cir/Yir/Bir, putative [Plasmodium chabaudi chabaudi]